MLRKVIREGQEQPDGLLYGLVHSIELWALLVDEWLVRPHMVSRIKCIIT